MGLELAKAYIRVRADASRITSDFRNLQPRVTSAAAKMGRIAGQAFAAAGLVGIGAAGALAVREAATFEDAMIRVRANARLLGNEGEKSFKKLERSARDMGATTRFSAVQAANALDQLVLGGLDAEKAVGVLPNVLNLAASSGIELASAAKIIVDNMVKFNMTAAETAQIGDFLSSAQSRAQTTAIELAVAHEALGSTAADMGVS